MQFQLTNQDAFPVVKIHCIRHWPPNTVVTNGNAGCWWMPRGYLAPSTAAHPPIHTRTHTHTYTHTSTHTHIHPHTHTHTSTHTHTYIHTHTHTHTHTHIHPHTHTHTPQFATSHCWLLLYFLRTMKWDGGPISNECSTLTLAVYRNSSPSAANSDKAWTINHDPRSACVRCDASSIVATLASNRDGFFTAVTIVNMT